MKEQSALHSSELEKMTVDSSAPSADLWRLLTQVRSLKD